MFKRVFPVLLLTLLPVSAFAEWQVYGNFYGYLSRADVVDDSVLNPGNRGAALPDSVLVGELRPDLQYRTESGLNFVLRSRHWAFYEDVRFQNPPERERRVDGDSDLTDTYVVLPLRENLFATLGLQNYQWGPAEIASPSNVFFHFNNNQRSFYFVEKGRVLARVNYSPAPDWTLILIGEPTDNRTQNWVYDREFKPQSALKIEKSFENPTNSFALVAGEMEGRTTYVGEHFTWSPVEGWSLYGDLRHQQKETHYRPVEALGGFYQLSDQDPDERWSTLAVLGLRFEARIDLRQEFILNEAGYDRADWDLVNQAVTTPSPYLVQNLSAFARPGLELRSRAYSYTSVRIPDLGPDDQTTLFVRYLASLSQDSSALQLNYEHNLNDEMVLSGELTTFLGEETGEFKLLSRGQASFGFRYSF